MNETDKNRIRQLLVDRCETEDLKQEAIKLYNQIIKALENEPNKNKPSH